MACAFAYGDARLEWMEKAYGDGKHNAFTDLTRWRGTYYLCFRHGTLTRFHGWRNPDNAERRHAVVGAVHDVGHVRGTIAIRTSSRMMPRCIAILARGT